jgi:hypothetical protein
MKIRQLYVLFLLVFLTILNIKAESIGMVIRGKVLGENNTSLYGAHVSIPSLERGTVTNENGEFFFTNIPLGIQRFAVSYIGYETLIQLMEINNGMNELIFTFKETAVQTDT